MNSRRENGKNPKKIPSFQVNTRHAKGNSFKMSRSCSQSGILYQLSYNEKPTNLKGATGKKGELNMFLDAIWSHSLRKTSLDTKMANTNKQNNLKLKNQSEGKTFVI